MQAEVFGSKQEEVVRRRQVKKPGRFKMMDQLALQSMVIPSVIFLFVFAYIPMYDTSENIGLRNINKRLMLFYTQEKGLYIESLLGEGTIVSFEIRKHT
ncbi:hypothetical protein BVG16_12845 [Paenibacillus selenitireducens]|uniref:Uncharacterized protein n=1 Tax=Paenibacillus selenitireducens TaxID=1324314 RepID=A0A1T2XFR8_9BACL|nr:hypothetical protein [Paenibacillus selenitireducens]OPA78729.1 hypothetical protein BVG16_12845 [Paenibacillus selenitireducens]